MSTVYFDYINNAPHLSGHFDGMWNGRNEWQELLDGKWVSVIQKFYEGSYDVPSTYVKLLNGVVEVWEENFSEGYQNDKIAEIPLEQVLQENAPTVIDWGGQGYPEYEPRIEPIPINDVKRTTVLNNRWSFYGYEESSHLVGRFTPNEWMRLQAGNAVDLVVTGESELGELAYGLQMQKAPQGFSGYMIFSGQDAPPLLLPTAQIDSENAPLSGGAVLSDAQIDELAKGSRVYVDESLYYEYTPATDTLRLINEIDGSIVKQGTFQTVLQVNKDGSAVSGGSGILLALGVVGIALSMSNRKSKSKS